MQRLLKSYEDHDIQAESFKVPTYYIRKMFIVPFIHKQNIVNNIYINVFRILTVGGHEVWAEDDSASIADILTVNGIITVVPPVKIDTTYFCKVDAEQTNMSDFYKWEEIEGIKERNKEELADKIDKGMLEKASLTLIGNDFRERNNQKKGLMKDIENKEDELKVTITSASAKRAQLKS